MWTFPQTSNGGGGPAASFRQNHGFFDEDGLQDVPQPPVGSAPSMRMSMLPSLGDAALSTSIQQQTLTGALDAHNDILSRSRSDPPPQAQVTEYGMIQPAADPTADTAPIPVTMSSRFRNHADYPNPAEFAYPLSDGRFRKISRIELVNLVGRRAHRQLGSNRNRVHIFEGLTSLYSESSETLGNNVIRFTETKNGVAKTHQMQLPYTINVITSFVTPSTPSTYVEITTSFPHGFLAGNVFHVMDVYSPTLGPVFNGPLTVSTVVSKYVFRATRDGTTVFPTGISQSGNLGIAYFAPLSNVAEWTRAITDRMNSASADILGNSITNTYSLIWTDRNAQVALHIVRGDATVTLSSQGVWSQLGFYESGKSMDGGTKLVAQNLIPEAVRVSVSPYVSSLTDDEFAYAWIRAFQPFVFATDEEDSRKFVFSIYTSGKVVKITDHIPAGNYGSGVAFAEALQTWMMATTVAATPDTVPTDAISVTFDEVSGKFSLYSPSGTLSIYGEECPKFVNTLGLPPLNYLNVGTVTSTSAVRVPRWAREAEDNSVTEETLVRYAYHVNPYTQAIAASGCYESARIAHMEVHSPDMTLIITHEAHGLLSGEVATIQYLSNPPTDDGTYNPYNGDHLVAYVPNAYSFVVNIPLSDVHKISNSNAEATCSKKFFGTSIIYAANYVRPILPVMGYAPQSVTLSSSKPEVFATNAVSELSQNTVIVKIKGVTSNPQTMQIRSNTGAEGGGWQDYSLATQAIPTTVDYILGCMVFDDEPGEHQVACSEGMPSNLYNRSGQAISKLHVRLEDESGELYPFGSDVRVNLVFYPL